MSKRYDKLTEAMCKELETLDKKYSGNVQEMTIQDLEKADKLYHALKSAETYHAMADASEWDEDESGEGRRGNSYGRSYATRRRDSMGRYTSRDTGRDMYRDDGYSGHYPEWMPPYYPQRY